MSEMNKCAECGMYVDVGTYHPYAACLMYQGCHDSQKVKANLDGVIAHGAQYESGFDDLADRYAALEARCRELEAENAALRHDLSKSMANHVADINGSQTETGEESMQGKVAGGHAGGTSKIDPEGAVRLRDPCPSAASGDNTQNLFLFPSKCCKCGKVDFFQEPQKGIYFCSYGCT